MSAKHLLLWVSLGCGSSSSLPPPGDDPPARPDQNDEGFQIESRRFYLVGDALTPAQDGFRIVVYPPSDDVEVVDLWIDGADPVRLERQDGLFVHERDISSLGVGEHEALLSADGAGTGFAVWTFYRSHPLYVVVTTDWDDADNPPLSLMLQEELHAAHPELLLTHFVGPYTFTDPAVSAARRAELADWV